MALHRYTVNAPNRNDLLLASHYSRVNDAAQGLGALLGLGDGKPDGLIGHQSQGYFDGALRQHPVPSIALLPGDEEDFLGGELAIPGIVGIAQFFHDDGALGEVKGPGFLDLMLPSRSDSHKGRQVAVVVQKGVELDPALVRLNEAQGNRDRQRLTTVASRL
jgi:hypothetical protein